MQSFFNILTTLTTRDKFVVAYSGGIDSHALLHAMHHYFPKKIIAVHVNHQLNSLSPQWALHCEHTCRELHIPCYIEKIDLQLQPGDSVEEKAREARYAIFQKYMNADTALLTAHTINDQAETFLLQALRGAGPAGLSAMPAKKLLGESEHLRPLLSFSRDTIEKYAAENKLQWIEDDSNDNTRFNRNFLRHDIFPVLKKRFPAVFENFFRSTRLIASQQQLLDQHITKEFDAVKMDVVEKIHLQKLRTLENEKQKLVLRAWFRENNLRMPSEKQLQQIQRDVLLAGPDANPVFCLEKKILKRSHDYLYLVSPHD